MLDESPPGSDPHGFAPLPGFLPHAETWLKLESNNPAGSIKAKAARAMIDSAEADGLLRPATELIESTSGNLGIALAGICAARGYRITLVTDPNANYRSVQQMRALGAKVVVVDERDHNGGYLGSRIAHISLRLAAEPNLVWLNQYANPANVAAHRDGTAVEITDNFGLPDWLFVGVGTSGTLMGCVEHFARIGATTTIVGVDTTGSITFGGPAARRLIPGLGSSRVPEIFTSGDHRGYRRVLVSEPDAILACRQMAVRYGLLLGGSSGTVAAAIRAHRHRIAPGSRVLAISPDHGHAYLDTVYNDSWVAAHFGSDVMQDIVRQSAKPARAFTTAESEIVT
ncbi:2,3-diaminopropionate biosynthesis protein SbnA [Streptomyces tendae]|uniref:2,3-diaminopropionate biosynthesis protein SbnA n=1 Tax=Streptomyces tendae TaxID=1932 RepID=UPI002490EC6A|nr:2,3-diaminopropionate biosynthesis protein SbnA [Streptomyces tendae]